MKVPVSVLRFLGYWYFKNLYNKILYCFYKKYKFVNKWEKLNRRFFWQDMKESLRKETPEEGCFCVVATTRNMLTYVSEFCIGKDMANKVFAKALSKYAGCKVIEVAELARERFILARSALKVNPVIIFTGSKKLKKKHARRKNVRSRRNIKRS